ncbi:hypothetical protein EMIT0324P_120012 [Pseudomonas chlororaphis]
MIESSLNAHPMCAFAALKLKDASQQNINFILTIKSIYGDRFEYNYKNNIQLQL